MEERGGLNMPQYSRKVYPIVWLFFLAIVSCVCFSATVNDVQDPDLSIFKKHNRTLFYDKRIAQFIKNVNTMKSLGQCDYGYPRNFDSNDQTTVYLSIMLFLC